MKIIIHDDNQQNKMMCYEINLRFLPNCKVINLFNCFENDIFHEVL